MGQCHSRKVGTVARLIIRPPRSRPNARITGKGFRTETNITRNDIIVKNQKGQSLHASHFLPTGAGIKIPTIVFLHGRSGSLEQCHFLLEAAISKGVAVFSFDFAGSGNSDGDFVSLGVSERYDVTAVVEHLSGKGVEKIVLWGHSMGAATALMYAALPQRNKSVKALIVDSSFTSIQDIIDSICSRFTLRCQLLHRGVVAMITKKARTDVLKVSGVDIHDIDPLIQIRNIKDPLPALFVHGEADEIVPLVHGKTLFAAYPGHEKKWLPITKCRHSENRGEDAIAKMMDFSMSHLLYFGHRNEGDLKRWLATELISRVSQTFPILRKWT